MANSELVVFNGRMSNATDASRNRKSIKKIERENQLNKTRAAVATH